MQAIFKFAMQFITKKRLQPLLQFFSHPKQQILYRTGRFVGHPGYLIDAATVDVVQRDGCPLIDIKLGNLGLQQPDEFIINL